MGKELDKATKALMKSEDVDDLKYVLSLIRDDPRLAQRFVNTLQEIAQDNEHKFSTIELEMFATMKMIFDTQVSELLMGNDIDIDDYVKLGALVKSMYEVLNKSLQNARVKERAENDKLKKLNKMEIPMDEDTTVTVKRKKAEVIDV